MKLELVKKYEFKRQCSNFVHGGLFYMKIILENRCNKGSKKQTEGNKYFRVTMDDEEVGKKT